MVETFYTRSCQQLLVKAYHTGEPVKIKVAQMIVDQGCMAPTLEQLDKIVDILRRSHARWRTYGDNAVMEANWEAKMPGLLRDWPKLIDTPGVYMEPNWSDGFYARESNV